MDKLAWNLAGLASEVILSGRKLSEVMEDVKFIYRELQESMEGGYND
ncbi:hypothetical protein [Clostridium formicaceticum]|jgi:hypothetical protein|uniref:Uncharacterized protein n=1 Tax=Clostridium formicaceticum TaxID=1497 RepID=A0AAC9RL06_9CLOT|nr:hypothetical protein [Clostridium formicaceticum]ARE87250.1 hypothetical protein CLFO_16490 [Clostridium formicaceticum]